jgi:plasmid replication initiation protein
MAATPYEILTFVGRGTSARDYDRSKPRSTGCNRRRS